MDVHVVITFLIFCFIRGSMSTCDEVAEPCYLFNTIEIPYMDTRHPNISLSSETMNDTYCDVYALDAETWYRSDYSMTTQTPDQQTCGANEPIWLNGTIPEVAEDTVSREACVRSFSDICSYTYTVKIKNCLYYTTYCFPSLPVGCHQRYCFDVNLTAITTTTTTTTSTSTITTPTTTTMTSYNNVETNDMDAVVAAMITLCVCVLVFGITFIVVYFRKVGWSLRNG